MNSSTATNPFMNPFLLWSRLAWQAGEMAMASAQVIGHRTSRLALAGPAPSVRDQREFTLMGQEKGAAALASAQAMGVPMMRMSQQFASLAFKQMLEASAALMSIGASRTPGESAGRQLKLVRDTLTAPVVAAAELSAATARVARKALAPVHSRVKGNVRRLRKR
jgi:hypothetical protein